MKNQFSEERTIKETEHIEKQKKDSWFEEFAGWIHSFVRQ